MLSSQSTVLLPLHTKHRRSAPALRNVVATALFCTMFLGTRSWLFATPISSSTHASSHAAHDFDLDAHGLNGSWQQHSDNIMMVIVLRASFVMVFALLSSFWCAQNRSWASTCGSVHERLSIVRALCEGRSEWSQMAKMTMPCAMKFPA
jgi:hypothetical protein